METRQIVRLSVARDRGDGRGDFSFHASAQPPRVIAGRDITAEAVDTGIEVIELLLELVSSRDWPGAA
jgi:hypothetical protein